MDKELFLLGIKILVILSVVLALSGCTVTIGLAYNDHKIVVGFDLDDLPLEKSENNSNLQ